MAVSGRLDALQNELLIATYLDWAYLCIDVAIGLANQNRHLDFCIKAIGSRFQAYVDGSGQLEERTLIGTNGCLAIPSDPQQEGRKIRIFVYAGSVIFSLPL